MVSTSIAFVIALVITAVLTPLVRDFAVRRDLAAKPRSERDVHEAPIPRVGGIAMVVGFMAPMVGLLLMDTGVGRFIQRDHAEWMRYVVAVFGGGLAIAALGLYDDLRGANAWQKLAIQILVATGVWSLGVRIDVLGFFGTRIDTGILSLPLTVLWIVAIVNAMNLIDGLDGLASGVAFMAVLPNLVLGIYHQNVVMMVLMAALGGAILGFLIYNFRPASVFMGDTGSMFLGFVLATGSILGNVKVTATVSMIAPVLALGLPIMDTLLAVLRRSLAGVPVFSADKDHLHHRLLNRGLGHRQTVLVLYGVSFILAGAALASAFARGRQIPVLILLVVCSAGVFLRKLGYLQRDPSRGEAHRVRQAIRQLCVEIRRRRSLTDIWRVIEPVHGMLPLAAIDLSVGNERHSWKDARVTATGSMRVELLARDETVGELRVAWRGFGGLEAEKTAVELIGDAVGDALGRIHREDDGNVIPLRRQNR